MPKLSDSMEEGTILSWLVAAGERGRRRAGPARGRDRQGEHDGRGGGVRGARDPGRGGGDRRRSAPPIARLGGAGAPAPRSPERTGEPAPDVPEPPPRPDPVPARHPLPAGDRPRAPRWPVASPRSTGSSIDSIGGGSGIGGRIVKADVLAAAGIAPRACAEKLVPRRRRTAERGIGVGGRSARSRPRRAARRTVELSRLQTRDRAADGRGEGDDAPLPGRDRGADGRGDRAAQPSLKAIAGDAPVPSFNDLIVRAAALALREHPKANGSYRDGVFELHDRVNVGIAVAADGRPRRADDLRRRQEVAGRDRTRLTPAGRAGPGAAR